MKSPNFDGDMKKWEDLEAWILGMNKFSKLHNYTNNMKARGPIFNLKGKENIWCEDVKQVRDIRIYDFSWQELKKLFRKRYFSKRYYDSMAKEFYQPKMGSMKNEEYMTKFLDLLRYPLCIADEKAKFQWFSNGFLLVFRDRIEYDEPRSLEEVIYKLKHCYEQSKCKNEYQQEWKGKYKGKGKWKPKRTSPQHANEKENVTLQKRFNAAKSKQEWKGKYKGKGKWKPKRTRPQHANEKENVTMQKRFNAAKQWNESHQQHRVVGTSQLECWTCGKEHLHSGFPHNQGHRPQIYSP